MRRAGGALAAMAFAAALTACELAYLSAGSNALAEDASLPADGPREADGPRPHDAGGAADARVDAPDGPSCDPLGAWEPPVAEKSLNNVAPSTGARITADGGAVYFQAGTPFRLYVAARSAEGTYGSPAFVPMDDDQQVGGAHLGFPAVLPDGLGIFHETTGAGRASIYLARRARATDTFGPRGIVAALASSENTGQPYVREDGAEIYFVSRREPAAAGSADIFRASLAPGGAVVDPVEHVGELTSAVDERSPVISADGLTLYFASLRGSDGTTATVPYVWIARRSAPGRPFSAPTFVTSLASGAGDEPTWIARDGCTMMLASRREGSLKIFTARRGR